MGGVVSQLPTAFVPATPVGARVSREITNQHLDAAKAAAAAAFLSASTPAFAAIEEEDEGFDVRIIAVLALPLVAVSWALFNVWRVALRQTVRIGEGLSGSSKIGLQAED